MNATPSGSSVAGGIVIDSPGPIDVIVPIRNRFQSHYCPNCGTSLITEEQRARSNSDQTQAEIMFWPVAILAFILGVGSFSPDFRIPIFAEIHSIGLSLVGDGLPIFTGIAVFAVYLAYLFYGSRVLWATFLVVVTGAIHYLALQLHSSS